MDRREFIAAAGVLALNENLALPNALVQPKAPEEYITAAYYFGNFHIDPRNEKAHGLGWTEWNLVRSAMPRFPGHLQPKIPLWGYQDESNPAIFEKKIDTAHFNGLNAMIFDWYWYNDGPFLNGALDRGFLSASNNKQLKFALMWANHDWYDIHPAKLTGPSSLQFSGAVSRATFDAFTEQLLKYFQHPSYLKIGGEPYFSIYELYRFIQGVGGVHQAADALNALRTKARAIGMPGVHINAITWGVHILPGQSEASNLPELLEQLDIASTTSYVWIHHTHFNDTVTTEYSEIRRQYESYRETAATKLGRIYFPNATVGWDSTPRACQTDNFRLGLYPFTSVVVNNSPQAFEAALLSAKEFAKVHLPRDRRLITINSWNEWTEGSYLEPDTVNGLAYLEAVRRVFGRS